MVISRKGIDNIVQTGLSSYQQMVSRLEVDMERTNSNTVEIVRLHGSYFDSQHGPTFMFGEFRKDNGRIVKLLVQPTFNGICLAVGFVGTGGRNIS